MGANDKVAATFYPDEEPTHIDAVSLAYELVDQWQLFTEEGGNDVQGEHVTGVSSGGRIVTVDWSNGQQFRIEVIEVMR